MSHQAAVSRSHRTGSRSVHVGGPELTGYVGSNLARRRLLIYSDPLALIDFRLFC